MIAEFVIVLAALQLAAPVRCYQTTAAWTHQTAAVGVRKDSQAYYLAGTDRHIALSPATCRDVLRPSLIGANVLAHELAHAWQDSLGLPFSERQADRIARWVERPLLTRLARLVGRRGMLPPVPDPPVVLAP